MVQDYFLLREQTSHGNAMFPFMLHEVETDPDFQERVGCHWHNEIELLTVTNGKAEICINDRSYFIQKGDILFIPPNHLHSVTGKPGNSFSFFAIDFQQAFLNSFINDDIQQKYFDPVTKGEILFPEYIRPKQEWERKISILLEDIRISFAQKEPGFELMIKTRLYEIWHLLYIHAQNHRAEDKGESNHRISTVKSIIEYIQAHYDNPLSLELLAEKFCVSTGHLCRLFKSTTKMSVVEYINFYRISKSTLFLRETDWEISRIAGNAGFNNISYFNKVFRGYMHMTPSEFRKNKAGSA